MNTKSNNAIQTKLFHVPQGRWGGTGVGVIIEKNVIRIEYDCADGEISGQLKIDSKGNFKINGTHRRRYPGPVRVNLLPRSVPASYEGKITGKTMTFKVTLIDTKEVIGTFTVERGKEPDIRRCL